MLTGIHDFALFVVAGVLLNLTPGPDMTYIAARAASGGFRDGLAATAGITTGCLVHTLAAAAGLSALLATSAVAFEMVKWVGAAYLAYAGVRQIVRAVRKTESGSIALLAPAPAARVFREAVLINVLNPKVALFFLAFLPQFISADAPAKPLAFIALGCVFNFNSLFTNVPVAWLASRAAGRIRRSARFARLLGATVGVLFVGLAARLALTSRQ
ncbi:MAG TPA: LysE family translocator [Casimicrobiaceae bacterium]|nr:LysE family translocator [Casimicrobiaceae bacterium]